jgi:hypothetical protein
MRPITRGLIVSVFWLALALGFTGALSNILQARHLVPAPNEPRDIIR